MRRDERRTHVWRSFIYATNFGAALVSATAAGAVCGPEWGPERPLSSATALDPREFAQLPVSAVFAQIYAPFYTAGLQGADAWRKAVAAEPAARRRLLELGGPLTIWFENRSTAEFLRVLFSGPVGDRAPEIAASLAEIGAKQQADALRQAIARFGAGYPRAFEDRARRMGPWDQPDAFARELMSFGEAFGPREEPMQAIAAYICDTPAIADWFVAARRDMREADRLVWIVHRLAMSYPLAGDPAQARAALALLPPPYRTLVLVYQAEGEVLNGGVSQFFSNSSGAFAPETADALREIGLPVRAQAIERAIALLPSPYPTRAGERRAALAVAEAAMFDTLDVLWRSESLEPAVVAFARSHDLIPR